MWAFSEVRRLVFQGRGDATKRSSSTTRSLFHLHGDRPSHPHLREIHTFRRGSRTGSSVPTQWVSWIDSGLAVQSVAVAFPRFPQPKLYYQNRSRLRSWRPPRTEYRSAEELDRKLQTLLSIFVQSEQMRGLCVSADRSKFSHPIELFF